MGNGLDTGGSGDGSLLERRLISSWGLLVLLASVAGCALPIRRIDESSDSTGLAPVSQMTDQQASEAAFLALGLVGTPYKHGGNTPESGFDCSGLIGYVYRRAGAITPPRTVSQLARWGSAVDADQVRTGDLVIFGSSGAATHAAIFVGESRFVHAPSTGGTVRLNSLRESYWASRMIERRRA